jgi:hypothetical protein
VGDGEGFRYQHRCKSLDWDVSDPGGSVVCNCNTALAGIESMLDWILKTTTSKSELWTNPALGLSETEAPPDKRGKWA